MKINLPKEKYILKMNVIGMRNLKSLGLHKVKKASFVINFNAIMGKYVTNPNY